MTIIDVTHEQRRALLMATGPMDRFVDTTTGIVSFGTLPGIGFRTRETSPASCLDCGRSYDDFGMDLLLPRWQWLAIHPDDGGLLCAICIVRRASKLPGAVALHGVIGIVPTCADRPSGVG